jgi:hypothetical protein
MNLKSGGEQKSSFYNSINLGINSLFLLGGLSDFE